MHIDGKRGRGETGLPNELARTGSGRESKKTALKSTKDRKLWRVVILTS